MSWFQLLGVAGAYLIGSVSFTRVVARWLIPNTPLATTETRVGDTSETWVYRGVSATTLLSRAGARWMVIVVVLDALKAAIPTALARLAWPDAAIYLLVALAAVAGHVWPVWHRFEGGRGQSSILGVLLVTDPLSIIFIIIVGTIIGLLVFTSVYAARNGWPAYIPIWFLWKDGIGPELAFSIGLSIVYLLAIRPDIAEESRVRQAIGFSELTWREKLVKSFADFFSTEDA